MTWRDVIKVLVCCGAVLLVIFAWIWAMETNMEISSLQDDVERLKSAQRPLVHIEGGKYLTIFTKEKEVVIETTSRNKTTMGN